MRAGALFSVASIMIALFFVQKQFVQGIALDLTEHFADAALLQYINSMAMNYWRWPTGSPGSRPWGCATRCRQPLMSSAVRRGSSGRAQP